MKERRDIVEETLVPGASVARVARRNDVNANQVFYWRKLFREGRLGISMNAQLLPVKVEAEQAAAADRSRPPQSRCAFLRAVRSFRQTLQHGAQSHHVHRPNRSQDSFQKLDLHRARRQSPNIPLHRFRRFHGAERAGEILEGLRHHLHLKFPANVCSIRSAVFLRSTYPWTTGSPRTAPYRSQLGVRLQRFNFSFGSRNVVRQSFSLFLQIHLLPLKPLRALKNLHRGLQADSFSRRLRRCKELNGIAH